MRTHHATFVTTILVLFFWHMYLYQQFYLLIDSPKIECSFAMDHVKNIYQEFLDRDPDFEGLKGYASAISQGKISVQELSMIIKNSMY